MTALFMMTGRLSRTSLYRFEPVSPQTFVATNTNVCGETGFEQSWRKPRRQEPSFVGSNGLEATLPQLQPYINIIDNITSKEDKPTYANTVLRLKELNIRPRNTRHLRQLFSPQEDSNQRNSVNTVRRKGGLGLRTMKWIVE